MRRVRYNNDPKRTTHTIDILSNQWYVVHMKDNLKDNYTDLKTDETKTLILILKRTAKFFISLLEKWEKGERF